MLGTFLKAVHRVLFFVVISFSSRFPASLPSIPHSLSLLVGQLVVRLPNQSVLDRVPPRPVHGRQNVFLNLKQCHYLIISNKMRMTSVEL